MPRKVVSLTAARRRKRKAQLSKKRRFKKLSAIFPNGEVRLDQLPAPFNQPDFPGFHKLDMFEAQSIIGFAIMMRPHRTKQDLWEPFITNPPKPKRLSHEEKLQRAWKEYREMLLFFMRLGLDIGRR